MRRQINSLDKLSFRSSMVTLKQQEWLIETAKRMADKTVRRIVNKNSKKITNKKSEY